MGNSFQAMAVAFDVPWETIKEQYVRGVSGTVLAKEYGITRQSIYQRAMRERWKPKVAKIDQQVSEAVKGVVAKRLQEAIPSIDDAIQRYKEKALGAAEGLVAKVAESLPEAAPRDLSGLASALLSSDTVARRTLGLDAATEDARTIAVAVSFPSLPVVSRPYTGALVDSNGTTGTQDTHETLDIPSQTT